MIITQLVLSLPPRLWLRFQAVCPIVLCCLLTPAYSAPVTPPTPGGRIIMTGSVGLSNLMSLWANDYNKNNPGVSITIADPGTAVGIEALINGSADVVLASTPLLHRDMDRFGTRFGYAPTSIPVAMDGVAVYVSTLNPLRHITLAQLDAIYSATLRCGAAQPLRTWDKLGITGELRNRPITALGLTVDTGSNQLFKHIALCDGDFRSEFQALAGPDAVQAALTANPSAIGFCSTSMDSAAIRALAIARQAGAAAVPPTAQAIRTGRYLLARTLSVIVNMPPNQTVDPVLQRFLDYARSAAGQALASKAGYVTLTQHEKAGTKIK